MGASAPILTVSASVTLNRSRTGSMIAMLTGSTNTGREQITESIQATRVPQPSYTMTVSSTTSTSGRSPRTCCACHSGGEGPQNDWIAAFAGSAANSVSTNARAERSPLLSAAGRLVSTSAIANAAAASAAAGPVAASSGRGTERPAARAAPSTATAAPRPSSSQGTSR